MAGRPIDNRIIRHVLAVMDQNRPEIHKQEGADKGHLVHGEEKRISVIRERLRKAIHGVEGVARVRRRHDPLVVRLVQVAVDERVMQPAVDPVDEEIGKDDEEDDLGPVVPPSGALLGRVV